ncbi:hypothetical protein EVAR_92418_1 [Eumeta japonica]|uniref:Uncharacterized protein n=1 Tax=Eumeta variegata TaxID=151549 RepID=A0A4C1T5S2_EUMVA|nr:hypothetical protein EVAR_92418_1 [Eumeta japonica]
MFLRCPTPAAGLQTFHQLSPSKKKSVATLKGSRHVCIMFLGGPKSYLTAPTDLLAPFRHNSQNVWVRYRNIKLFGGPRALEFDAMADMNKSIPLH